MTATRRLQRSRTSGSFVLVSHREQPWGHGPRWTLPLGVATKEADAAQRAYTDRLVRYRVALLGELKADPELRLAFEQLRGRRLACPCRLEVRCPTDILSEALAAFRAEGAPG